MIMQDLVKKSRDQALVNSDGKICSKCKVRKPLSEFDKTSASGDDHSVKCKDCSRKYEKRRKAKD